MPAVANTIERVLGRAVSVGDLDCWKLIGLGRDRDGYTKMSCRGVTYLAHRYVFQELIGSIQHDLTLDHLCRHRWCCNPGHLEPVTMRVNVLRGDTITFKNSVKTHCLHGHKLNSINVRVANGRRVCRPCCAQRTARWKRDKK